MRLRLKIYMSVRYVAREQDQHVVDAEIQKADVVVVVYDVARQDTFDRIEAHWLPKVRALTADKTVDVRALCAV